ncbi:EamA/RhaT family transporter [Phreatobacter aquaticus]|uniref:EamA/RhaT family transporter n=1 Tax=Phreatobacter aquaticus TaxID=2570229 RepID=A0A4D7QMW1_9HYPH|nr:EamA/RhaT family transporter [Phreatobacter aquaticus]
MRLIPVALALLWGFNWPAVKIALAEVPPFAIRMVGLGAGALLLLAVAAVFGRSLKVPRKDWRPLLVAGLLNIGVFNLAVVFAQLSTSTSRAAILTFTMPLWSVLFAYLFLGERIDARKGVALVLGTVGIGCLAAPLFQGQGALAGLIFPLVAALSWTAGTLYMKVHPITGDRVSNTAYQLLVAAALSGLCFLVAGETLPATLSGKVWLALGYHVVFATAMAYLLWFILLNRFSAGSAALTTLAIPVVGVLGAMALIGERPSLLDLAGFAAVLAAASLTMFSRPEAA